MGFSLQFLSSRKKRRSEPVSLAQGSVFLFLCALFLVVGCAGQRKKGMAPSEALFMRAEIAFEAKSYDRAESLYAKLAARYPRAATAPAALFKQAMILGQQGKKAQAQKVFENILARYGDSSFASLAKIESLNLLYRHGDYVSVIQKGLEMKGEGASFVLTKHAIVGDAYLALGARVDALDAYFAAHKGAAGEPQEAALFKKIQKAAEGLSLGEAENMLGRVHEKRLRAFLLFVQVKRLAEKDRVDEALVGLGDFLALYSDHPLRNEAMAFRDTLTKAGFSSHTLGLLLPFTGRYGAYGKRMEKGVSMAFQKAAKVLGLSDAQVLFSDTGSDDETTKEAVRQLAEAGVAAIIGPVGNVEAAAEEAQLRGVPLIAFTGKEGVAASGDFVFRNFMTRRMQARAVASYAFEVLGLNDFSILYPDEPYGKDFMSLFWDEVDRFGGEIKGAESYKSGTKDFADAIKKLTGTAYERGAKKEEKAFWGRVLGEKEASTPQVNFEAIFIPDGPEALQLILPQLAFHDLGGVYTLGTNLWHHEKLLKAAPGALKNSVIPDGFFGGSRRPKVARFVRRFRRLYSDSPSYFEAISYDSALMIFSLVASENPRSRSDVRDALLRMSPFGGVTGKISFDENGALEGELVLLKGRGRRFGVRPR